MTPSNLIEFFKREKRTVLAALLVIAFAVLYLGVSRLAENEARSRKSPAALVFEKDPQKWLKQPREISDFQRALEDGTVQTVGVASRDDATVLLYTLKDGSRYSAFVPACSTISCTGTVVETLGRRSATAGFTLVSAQVDWRGPNEIRIAQFERATSAILYVLFMAGFFLLALHMQSGNDKESAGLAARPKERFNDVIGAQEAKVALSRVSSFMLDPSKYVKLGARAPRGVLLVGPPGTGKTLLAKALAGETNANFIAVDGSYFTSMFFAMGVLKVRKLFRQARRHAPCIIFIDEFDGIGRRTSGEGMNASSNEMNRIINRFLVEMDGFSASDRVIVVGATNHVDNIDPALRRAGRFDMTVTVELPTIVERQQLFDCHIGKLVSVDRFDAAVLARMTSGMSPADIENTVNKAASTAAEQGASSVAQEHLLRAVESFQLGGDVRSVSKILSSATRQRLAYHEGAHALVAHLTRAGNVERISIQPRGVALGVTFVTRESEDPLYARQELAGRLAMMLAGREAELMVFHDVSSGASDDLKRATELAVSMVSTLGFSDVFGLLSVAGVPKELLAPQTQEAALNEARELLAAAQARCKQLLHDNRPRLERLAESLLDREVLSGVELAELLGPVPTAAQARLEEAAVA